jgi:ABC-2 type transport system ATP-binding protein
VLGEYAATGVPVVFSSHQLDLVERLCQAVAIIKDGRLVASGSVEELRGDRGTIRVVIDGAEHVVPGENPDAVLDWARAQGSVSYFAQERPTLAELFREAVS